MSNWAKLQEDIIGLPVHKRARHGIHFDKGNGEILASFVGKPCHYLDAGLWKPIDTALIPVGNGFYGSPHSDVLIHTDGRVKVGNYQQLSELVNAKTGKIDGDRIVREFGFGMQYLCMKEDGFRQETVITRTPTTAEAKYLIASELGELPGHYKRSEITAIDADGDMHVFVNLGQFKKWLDGAKYPVTIDPDFAAVTASGYIYGTNAAYATARSTSSGADQTVTSRILIGQTTAFLVSRGFVGFDTSSIDDGAIIAQANLKLVVYDDKSVTDFDIQIVKQDWSAWESAEAVQREATYDACLAGTADDNIWRNTSGMSINTVYTSGNLATGWISKTGKTYYSLRSSLDLAGTQPSGNEYVYFASDNYATEAYRPVLTITYPSVGHPAVNRMSQVKFVHGYGGR